MERRQIRLISVVERHGTVVARAWALASDAGGKILVEVVFENSERKLWQDARDRVLAVLDPA